MDKLKDIKKRISSTHDELMNATMLLQAVFNAMPGDKKDDPVPCYFFVGWAWDITERSANELDKLMLEVHNLANNKKGCP